MGGIRTTTREQALEALLARTRQEIACTLRRENRLELPRLYRLEDRLLTELGHPRRRTERVQSRLVDLGVTARQVKEWAVAQGLVPARAEGDVVNAPRSTEKGLNR